MDVVVTGSFCGRERWDKERRCPELPRSQVTGSRQSYEPGLGGTPQVFGGGRVVRSTRGWAADSILYLPSSGPELLQAGAGTSERGTNVSLMSPASFSAEELLAGWQGQGHSLGVLRSSSGVMQ